MPRPRTACQCEPNAVGRLDIRDMYQQGADCLASSHTCSTQHAARRQPAAPNPPTPPLFTLEMARSALPRPVAAGMAALAAAAVPLGRSIGGADAIARDETQVAAVFHEHISCRLCVCSERKVMRRRASHCVYPRCSCCYYYYGLTWVGLMPTLSLVMIALLSAEILNCVCMCVCVCVGMHVCMCVVVPCVFVGMHAYARCRCSLPRF